MLNFVILSLLYSKFVFSLNNPISVELKDLNPRSLGQFLCNEQYKILFCPIEKVMSTQFRQLFDRLDGDPNWYQNPYHKIRPNALLNKTLQEVQIILNDPTWTKAIIFRDPARRLLSSYLHLIKSPNSLKRYKTMFYQRNLSTTWEDFLQISLETNGIQNIHWNPQTNFCGFRKFWPLFTFVGNYELIQRDHGRILSQQAGLNNFTLQGWSLTKNMKYMNEKRKGAKVKYQIPSDYNHGDCLWCRNHAPHKNNYQTNPINKYLTPEVWKLIRNSQKYRQDYSLFHTIQTLPFNFSIYNNNN